MAAVNVIREQQNKQDLDSLPSNCSETEDFDQLGVNKLVDVLKVDRVISPNPSMHHKNPKAKNG